MGLPVTVYRWDDAGAPQLINKTPSEWITILKKCLVEGYGSKAGAGWSIDFEDAAQFKIAFRSSPVDGIGGYVQFWSNNATDTVGASFLYKAAHGMTSLDGFVKAGFSEVIKGGGSQGNISHWMIIATSVGFYLFSMQNNISTLLKGYYSIFVGELHSFSQNDAGRFVGTGGQTANRTSDTSISPISQALFFGSVQARPLLYGVDGSTASVSGSSTAMFPVVTDNLIPSGNDVDAGVTLNFTDVLIYGSQGVDSLGNLGSVSIIQPYVRGKLPGLLESSFTGYKSTPFPYIRTFFGQQYMLSPVYSQATGLKHWINIEEWY